MSSLEQRKLKLNQERILDELNGVEPIGQYSFWSYEDTLNYQEGKLAKADLVTDLEGMDRLYDAFCGLVDGMELHDVPLENKKPLVGTDVETTGLDYSTREVIGYGFALPKDYYHYLELLDKVPVGDEIDQYFNYFFVHTYGDRREVRERLVEILKEFNSLVRWSLHNAKFDQHWVVSRTDIMLRDIEDSMVMCYLLGEQDLAIDKLAPKYLSRFPTTLSRITGLEKEQLRNAPESTFLEIDLQTFADYCAEDCVEGLLLGLLLGEKLKQQKPGYGKGNSNYSLWNLYVDSDLACINALVWMEQKGVDIDWELLDQVQLELDAELSAIKLDIAVQSKMTITKSEEICASPQKLSRYLYEELGLPTQGIKQGKTGFYSTDEKSLQLLSRLHPVPEAILDYREFAKLQSTYIQGLLERQRNGRIHTTFLNCRTYTGRLASEDPNLQNIPNPAKSDVGKTIRQMFRADEGMCLVKADYSQFELRILAHLSQDPYLLSAYRNGLDVHSVVACLLFDIAYDQFDPNNNKEHKKLRTLCKTVNFGLIYGMTAFRLFNEAKKAGLDYTFKRCQEIMSIYWERLAGVTTWMAETKLLTVVHGYCETALGRRRYFDFEHSELKRLRGKERTEISYDYWLWLESKGYLNDHKDQASFRQIGNAPVQGTNADVMRIALGQCFRRWYETSVFALLTVHDEIVLECPVEIVQDVMSELVQIMQGAIILDVPVVAEASASLTWGDC